MAKLTRPNERYVPQQESYRNLPGLRPTAQPVDIVADEVAVDPTAEKLKQLAQGLGMANKAIEDFYRMEKSFEETNRLAARVNAKQGLAPPEGKGFLKYGLTEGHYEGLGINDALTIRGELDGLLEQELPSTINVRNPQQSLIDLQSKIDSWISERVGGMQENPAYMRGVSNELAKFKVEAMAKGQALIQERVMEQKFGIMQTKTEALLGSLGDEAWGDPQVLRNSLRPLLTDAEALGFDRAAGAKAIMTSLETMAYNRFNAAYSAGDLRSMRESMQQMRAMMIAIDLPDESGVKLGGFTKDSSGNIKWNLASDKDDLQVSIGRMQSAFDKTLETQNKVRAAAIQADMLVLLQEGEDPGRIRETLEPLSRVDPELYVESMKFLFAQEESQNYINDTQLVRTMIAEGADIAAINRQMALGNLSRQGATQVASAHTKLLSERNALLTERNKLQYSANMEHRNELARIDRNNRAMLGQLLATGDLSDKVFRKLNTTVKLAGHEFSAAEMLELSERYKAQVEAEAVPPKPTLTPDEKLQVQAATRLGDLPREAQVSYSAMLLNKETTAEELPRLLDQYNLAVAKREAAMTSLNKYLTRNPELYAIKKATADAQFAMDNPFTTKAEKRRLRQMMKERGKQNAR